MLYEYLIQLGIIFAWHAFAFRSNILLYLTNWHINIRFSTNAKYFFFASFSLYILGIFLEFLDTGSLEIHFKYLLPTGLYFLVLLVFSYGTTRGNFTDLASVVDKYEKFVGDEPEMIVVQLQSHPNASENTSIHVIPIKYLRARDLILPITVSDLGIESIPNNSMRYSLTYCLLCNTVHAYLLPYISEKEIEISSRGGSVVNGNKVLADGRGKHVWQQFTGQGISGKAKTYPLIELHTVRFLWKYTKEQFPEARYYFGSIQMLQHGFYRNLGKAVSKLPFLRLEISKIDTRLGAKVPIVGINLIGDGVKAYPLEIFTPGEFKILEDAIGNAQFSLVYNGHDVIGFREQGLNLKENSLQKGEKSWSILGNSMGEHEDLAQISVTGHAYWYLWSKFYPDTELYSES